MKKAHVKAATTLVNLLISLRVADPVTIEEVQDAISNVPAEELKSFRFVLVRGANSMFNKKTQSNTAKLKPLP